MLKNYLKLQNHLFHLFELLDNLGTYHDRAFDNLYKFEIGHVH